MTGPVPSRPPARTHGPDPRLHMVRGHRLLRVAVGRHPTAQATPFMLNVVGVAGLLVQLPEKPNSTSFAGGMTALVTIAVVAAQTISVVASGDRQVRGVIILILANLLLTVILARRRKCGDVIHRHSGR